MYGSRGRWCERTTHTMCTRSPFVTVTPRNNAKKKRRMSKNWGTFCCLLHTIGFLQVKPGRYMCVCVCVSSVGAWSAVERDSVLYVCVCCGKVCSVLCVCVCVCVCLCRGHILVPWECPGEMGYILCIQIVASFIPIPVVIPMDAQACSQKNSSDCAENCTETIKY